MSAYAITTKSRVRCIATGLPLLVLVFGATVLQAQSRSAERWVGTWATAVQAPVVLRLPPAPPPAPGQAAAAPATPPAAPLTGFKNQTIRQIVRTSIGGNQARVTFTNVYGTDQLEIGAASIAVRDKDAAIVPASSRPLTFGGRPSIIIPPGATVLSDPAPVAVPALGDLAVDIFLPGDTAANNSPLTLHVGAWQTNYVSMGGNHTGAATLPIQTTAPSYFFLSRIDVTVSDETAAIVTFGDSITDGTNSTPNTNNRWPNHLAKRLMAAGGQKFGVLNGGISGNRVLSDGLGVSALQRFERDALDQPGVTHVVVLEGINDVGLSSGLIPGLPKREPAPTAEDIIQGHQQLIARAHLRGVKIYGATLTPYEGARYWSAEGEKTRQAINQWLRTSRAYDGIIDFESALKDPQNPTKFLPKYDSGDHLHPSDLGYQVMADAVNLELFKAAGKGSK
jgi:lysophospholipase L1-like esterase